MSTEIATLDKPKRGRGRPPFVPTDEQRSLVRLARACGAIPPEIAIALKIDKLTLYRHFREDLDTAKTAMVIRMGAQVVTKALAGDNEMIKFYLRCHGGQAWKERHQLEHVGPGGTVPPNLVVGFLLPEQPANEPPTIEADAA